MVQVYAGLHWPRLRPRGNCKQAQLYKWEQGRLCVKRRSLQGILWTQTGVCCLVILEVFPDIIQLRHDKASTAEVSLSCN